MSHLIKAVHKMTHLVFRQVGQGPSEIYALLMVPSLQHWFTNSTFCPTNAKIHEDIYKAIR